MTAQEELARLRVALNLASWLLAAGRHSAEAANANAVGWKITMQLLREFGADFRADYVPSEDTIREVVRIMAMFEERAALCQASHNLAAERVADEDAPCLCTRKGDYEDVRGCPVHDA